MLDLLSVLFYQQFKKIAYKNIVFGNWYLNKLKKRILAVRLLFVTHPTNKTLTLSTCYKVKKIKKNYEFTENISINKNGGDTKY